MSQEINQSPMSGMAPGQVPMQAKNKMNAKLIVIIIVSVLAGIVLIAGGGSAWWYVSGNIDGNYHAASLEKAFQKEIEEKNTDSDIDYSKIFTDMDVDIKVKDDQAVARVTYKVDTDEAYKVYQDTIESQLAGFSSEQKQFVKSQIPSKEAVISDFNDTIEESAEEDGLTYNSDTGVVSGTIFKGKVNRWSRKIEVTNYNSELQTNDDDATFKDLKGIKKGSTTSYKKTSSGITLTDSSDSDTLKLEKK